MTQVAIFDMDGTLVDSMPALQEHSVQLMCQHYGVTQQRATELFVSTVGLPFRRQLEMSFPRDTKNDVVSKLLNKFHKQHARTFPLAPGVLEMARDLHLSGVKLALVSSTRTEIIMTMRQLDELHMSWIEGYYGYQKDAQIREVLSVFQVAPWDARYFGDTVADHTYAEKVKVPFHMVTVETTASVVREAIFGEVKVA